VKLLFDQNLSLRLVKALAELYPDSQHVHRLELDEADDRKVWDFAKEHSYCIVTKDADFSDLALLLGQPPKVLWIRRGNCKTSDIETSLRHHYKDIITLGENPINGVLALF
jgi:predicted nuclease of predicted toxin-antitoxin system